MVITAQQLITDAMSLCGAVAVDETPTASELSLGLRTLNIMLNNWSAKKLMLRSSSPLTFTMTAAKASYTVGLSGCDVTANKIITVNSGYVTDGSMDYTLEVISAEQYDNLSDKNVSSGRPFYVTYDAGVAQQTVQKGTLSFYPLPASAYSVTLDIDAYLTEISAVGDTLTFEPSYYEALVYSLAVRLFRHFHAAGTQIPVDIAAMAATSMNAIMSMNATQVTCAIDIPTGDAYSYNIFTDS